MELLTRPVDVLTGNLKFHPACTWSLSIAKTGIVQWTNMTNWVPRTLAY